MDKDIESDPGRVYPRVCGGTPYADDSDDSGSGLSPRVRGNRERRHRPPLPVRSIPACAGEPANGYDRAGNSAVYPRVCGGTAGWWVWGISLWGLSPRVRGNRAETVALRDSAWSIPACAGEPAAGPSLAKDARVYPRVCGGTRRDPPAMSAYGGLSPRVRGNPLRRDALAAGPRSIPACAGEPASVGSSSTATGVYPRVCGGNPRLASAPLRGFGSIPACAGEPRKATNEHACDEVYPRVCGGTHRRLIVEQRVKGLSPRVRGNPPAARHGAAGEGSIPACAGEPRPAPYRIGT